MITLYEPKVAIIIVTLFFGAILMAILWMFIPESDKRLGELRRCKSYQRLKYAKSCLEELSHYPKGTAYRSTVEAMNEAILLIQSNDFPVSREKISKTLENLYHEADSLNRNGESELERKAFNLMAQIMRENGASIEKVFVGELVFENGGAKK